MEIIFLHGFASNSEIWQGYEIKGLKNTFWNITFDEKGNLVLPKIEKKTILVAWSMGGMVALEILKKYSDKIVAVFFLSSSPTFIKTEIFPQGKTKRELEKFEQGFFDPSGKGVAKFQQQLFSKEEIRAGFLKKFRKEIAPKLKVSKTTLINSLNFLKIYKISKSIETSAKIFVFHGKNDVVVDVLATKSWKKLFPDASVFVLDASHSLPFVKKELVVEKIEEFCNEYR